MALAKGVSDKTVGKLSTQKCGTGNGVKEPQQTGSPYVISTVKCMAAQCTVELMQDRSRPSVTVDKGIT